MHDSAADTANPNFRIALAQASIALPPQALFALDHGPAGADTDPRRWRLPLTTHCGAGQSEHWLLEDSAPVATGQENRVHWSDNGHYLFARITLPAMDALKATEEAYRALSGLIAQRGHSHWLRTWNYLGAFNKGLGDAERYRQFCLGRARVASAVIPPPAATAIGIGGMDLHVAVLASRTAGSAIENPRQTAAWRYPREYGPQSPGFSRAMRVGPLLLVSGTASVVGHQTLHPLDAAAQLQELTANLAALLAQAGGGWQAQSYKLYVRSPEDVAAMAAAFGTYAGATPWVLLQGDISRSDLVVEVEAVYRRIPA